MEREVASFSAVRLLKSDLGSGNVVSASRSDGEAERCRTLSDMIVQLPLNVNSEGLLTNMYYEHRGEGKVDELEESSDDPPSDSEEEDGEEL